MRAEQLAHKIWLALDKVRDKEICTSTEGVALIAKIQTRDAFSCAFESLSLRWEVKDNWEALAERCEKALKTLHKDFTLVERDDLNQLALYRSPLTREFYWEAQLKREKIAILTVNRYQIHDGSRRTFEPFILTEEQLTEFIASAVEV